MIIFLAKLYIYKKVGQILPHQLIHDKKKQLKYMIPDFTRRITQLLSTVLFADTMYIFSHPFFSFSFFFHFLVFPVESLTFHINLHIS
jgi:hypothetical protein